MTSAEVVINWPDHCKTANMGDPWKIPIVAMSVDPRVLGAVDASEIRLTATCDVESRLINHEQSPMIHRHPKKK